MNCRSSIPLRYNDQNSISSRYVIWQSHLEHHTGWSLCQFWKDATSLPVASTAICLSHTKHAVSNPYLRNSSYSWFFLWLPCTPVLYFFRFPSPASDNPLCQQLSFLGSLMPRSEFRSLRPSFLPNIRLMDFVRESHKNIVSYPVLLDRPHFYWGIILSFFYWLTANCFIYKFLQSLFYI